MALLGTAWFVYKIAHRVPAVSLVALVCIVYAALTGVLVRFNEIRLDGLAFDEVGSGMSRCAPATSTTS